MNSSALVSVIVPVYNVEPYIDKCIQSIVFQTYNNIEIILVDDGSKDNSGKICDIYAESDNRIRVIHQQNSGHNIARKNGLSVSQGEYICFIDSDDWIESNMISEMIDNIIVTRADFIHTGTILETKDKTTVDCRYDEKVIENPKDDLKIWHEIMNVDTDNYINRGLARKLFKKDLIQRCYLQTPDDIKYGEDFVTVVRCLFECKKVSFLKKAYYHYNIREDSISRTIGIERIYMAVYQYEEIRKIFSQYNTSAELNDILERACIKETFNVLASTKHISGSLHKFSFDNINILRDKRIIIYGAGKVGNDYYSQLSRYTDINIVSWIDSFPEKYGYPERIIDKPATITEREYDYILIAVLKSDVADSIKKNLTNIGVDEEKIIWEKPQNLF